jgi:DNA-binding MarR family transcriptional regulator
LYLNASSPHLSEPAPQEGTESSEPIQVLEALARTTHLLKRSVEFRIAHANFPAKLSAARVRVIFEVERASRMRMSDLAAILHIAPRSVTDLIDGLEHEGLITRHADPADRRATLLEVTPAARAMREQIQSLRQQTAAEILAPLSPQQQSQLLTLLGELQRGPLGELEDAPACDLRHVEPSPH